MAQWRHRGQQAPYQPVVLDQCLDCNIKQGYQLLHEWKPELPSLEILLRDGFPQPKMTPAYKHWLARQSLVASMVALTDRIRAFEQPYASLHRQTQEAQLKRLVQQGPAKPLLWRAEAFRRWRNLVLRQHHLVMRARHDEEQVRVSRAADLAKFRARLAREEERLSDLMANPPQPEPATGVLNDDGWRCPDHDVFEVRFTRMGREYRACTQCSDFERLP